MRNDISIKDRYTKWMYNIVCENVCGKNITYYKLFSLLNNLYFETDFLKDDNRAQDGIDMRYHFLYERGLNDPNWELSGPCTIWEMILALSIRMEKTITYDYQYGDRTKQWFWSMLGSLGIGYMTDMLFDASIVKEVINKLLKHEYESNGNGGLFFIPNTKFDLRKVEIWDQMMLYLNQTQKID